MDIGNIPQPPKLPNLYARAAKIVKALLGDQPNEVLMGFLGYYHSIDQTFLKPNCLTFPSQNCFIPLKDKIVPRAGKTLLGQPFTKSNVDIAFDQFTLDQQNTLGPISEYTPLQIGTPIGRQNFSIKIDSTHILNIWSNSVQTSDEFFIVLSAISGTFVPGDQVTDLSSGATGIFISVSGSNYLFQVLSGVFGGSLSPGSISGATATFSGFISATEYSNMQVFQINPSTGAMTALGLPYVFDSQSSGNFSVANIDGQHFVGFWNGTGGGNVQVFNIAPSTYIISVLGSPLVIDANSIGSNSCVLVNGSHVLNFWNHNSTAGYAQVFAINLSTFAVTAVGSPLSFDTTINNISNSCGQIDSTHFINFWTSNSNVGKTQAFAVNLSTFAVTAMGSPLTFDAIQATFNSCAFIDSTHFINFWNHGLTGIARTFAINASTYAITAINSNFTFSSFPVVSNSCAALSNVNFINFWSETTGFLTAKQYAQVFSLDELYNIVSFELPLQFDSKFSNFNSCVFIGNGATASQQLITNFWDGQNSNTSYSGDVAVFQVTENNMNFNSAHGCSGDNRILFVSIITDNSSGGDVVTGVTYNGVAMTLAEKVTLSSQREEYLYYLVAPTAGVLDALNGINITTSGIDRTVTILASSYNGAAQTAPTIMSKTGPTPGSSISISEIPVIDRSWIMAFFSGGPTYSGGLTPGAGTTFRGGTQNFQMADSGALITPPAATALSASFISSTSAVAIAVAFAPIGGTPVDKEWPIVGHKKRYTTDGGYSLEVRIIQTGDPALKDIVEILFPNPLTGINQWYPITEKSNPLPAGTAERYYMDQYFDTNLNPIANRNNSRLVWVNGTRNIFSWSGGVAPIVSIISGVSISIDPTKTFASSGFIIPSLGGLNFIIINGIKYQVLTNIQVISLSSVVGTFQVGDLITGSISGATGKILSVSGASISVGLGSGAFLTDDLITGSISGATAEIGTVDTQDGGWSTNTLLLANTDGINIGDVATAYIMPANSPTWMQDTNILPNNYSNIDYCRQNKNYMFYGSFVSRKLFMSNVQGQPAIEIKTVGSGVAGVVVLDDLNIPLVGDFTGLGTVTFNVVIDSAAVNANTFKWGVTDFTGATFVGPTGVTILPGVSMNLVSPFGTISISFGNNTDHGLYDSWNITATQSIGNININQVPNFLGNILNQSPWCNFFYSLPRLPGQGYIWPLAANFNTMEPQEDSMYVNDKYGNWGYIDTILNASAQTETINFTPLKQDSSSKVLYPYLVSHMDNSLIFITDDKNLNEILRKQLVELPQIGYLSEPVSKDFQNLTFHNGSMEYVGKRLFITSPEDNFMMVFDDKVENKYWQPPQSYAENGILSVVENTLISHSNLRNQTFNLFTGTDDDGAEYTVNAVSPANAWGDRWGIKAGNKSFLEGYYGGGPVLKANVYLGINGEQRIITHVVDPIFNPLAQEPTEQAPLGEGNIASHQLGSDLPQNPMSHFNEIWTSYDPIMQFYFVALGISCIGKKHTYEILSMGINSVPSALGNSELIPEEIISKI